MGLQGLVGSVVISRKSTDTSSVSLPHGGELCMVRNIKQTLPDTESDAMGTVISLVAVVVITALSIGR